MDLLITKLYFVFLVIIAILWTRRPPFMIIFGDFVAALVPYGIPATDAVVIMSRFMASRDTITVVLNFYFIAFLRRMLECRGRLKQTEESLNGLFNNQRINASAVPAMIRLLPSAGATNLCAETIKPSCEDHMSREDMIAATSFLHHIPECFLPTYPPILIALAVLDIGAGEFVVVTVPLVTVLFLIEYMFYLGKLSKATGRTPKGGRTESAEMLIRSLQSILSIVVLIIAAGTPVYAATPLMTVLNVFVDRLGMERIRPTFRSAPESITIFNTILIMTSKDTVTSTGVIHELPTFFGSLPISMPLVFALIFFLRSIISGANVIIPLCTSTAMVAMPQGGVPLLVLLMNSSYAAMQTSPTHVCLSVTAGYFKVNIGKLMKRNIPMILLFFAAALGYMMVLGVF